MQRSCDQCGQPYQAKRPSSKYCTQRCGKRARRAPKAAPEPRPATEPEPPLVAATRRDLEAAECLDTTLGWASIELARRIGSAAESGSSVASMVKVLRETMTEALKGTTAPDLLDELRDRRDAKRNAG